MPKEDTLDAMEPEMPEDTSALADDDDDTTTEEDGTDAFDDDVEGDT